jgi:hypothetical protein
MENRGKYCRMISRCILRTEIFGMGGISELCPVANFGTSDVTFWALIPERQPGSYLKLDFRFSGSFAK